MVSSVEEHVRTPLTKRVSWAAIFGGLVVALVLQLVLSLLGLGIGAGTIHPTSENGASAQSVGTGSVVWFVVTSIISLFAGGWIAGRLAGIPQRTDAVLHAVIAWSLTSLLTVYLLTTAIGGIISGATGALGSVLSAAGSGIAAAAPAAAKAATDQAQKSGLDVNSLSGDLSSRVQQILRETGNEKLSPEALQSQAEHSVNDAKNSARRGALNPQDAKDTTNNLLYRFLHEADATKKAADRQSLINVVAAEQHISKAQAARTVDGWSAQAKQLQQQAQQTLEQAQEKAKQAGDATAAAVSKAALSAFFLFIVGGIAAALGGALSVKSIIAEAVYEEKRRYSSGTTVGESRIHHTTL